MIDFTEDTEPARELEVLVPAGELEAELPAIEPGLEVLMRAGDSGAIWVVKLIDKQIFLVRADGSGSMLVKPKTFWSVCKPLGPIRKALELQPAVEVGLRVRIKGSVTEGTVLSVTATHAKVKGLYADQRLERFWDDFELIEDPRAQKPDRSKLPRLLEIAAELAQIAKLIEELSLGYGATDEGKIAAYSSQVFRTLTDRQDELRSELVALG